MIVGKELEIEVCYPDLTNSMILVSRILPTINSTLVKLARTLEQKNAMHVKGVKAVNSKQNKQILITAQL